jgi:hypothetical protein
MAGGLWQRRARLSSAISDEQKIEVGGRLGFGVEDQQPFDPSGAQQPSIRSDQNQVVSTSAQIGGEVQGGAQQDGVCGVDRVLAD